MTSTLARFTAAPAIVAAYQETAATIRRTFAELVATEERLNIALGHEENACGRVSIDASRGRHLSSFWDADTAVEQVRLRVWGDIVDRMELRRFLSVAKWTELQAALRSGKTADGTPLPEITLESVADLVSSYQETAGAMFDDALREVFDLMRPRNSKLKTNAELYEVPTKVVLHHYVEAMWQDRRLSIRYDREQELIAIERAFQGLDGCGTINKTHYSEIGNALRLDPLRHVFSTTYFAVRRCQNGNLHLAALRPDLLAELNRRVGGSRFRPSKNTGATRGTEMVTT